MKIDINIYQIFGLYHASCEIKPGIDIVTDTTISFSYAFLDMGGLIGKLNINILDPEHELTIKLIHA